MGKISTPQVPRTFAAKFEAALQSRNVGVRTLARRIVDKQGVPAGTDYGKRVDNVRRQLNSYRGIGHQSPIVPREAMRHLIEDALEMKRDELEPDDEEEDPEMRMRRIRAELVLTGRDDLADELRKLTRETERSTA